MIIGSGLLASSFNKYMNDCKYLFFASGVSNSNETRNGSFSREENLLRKAILLNRSKHFIYFSSCDVIYSEELGSAYFHHKKRMEEIVIENCKLFTIFRLPQVISKSNNPNLLVNYFKSAIVENRSFDIWVNATKNLIHIDDVINMIDFSVKNKNITNMTLNIINLNYYSVDEIVESIANYLNVTYTANYINKGFKVCYDDEFSQKVSRKIGVNFSDDYIRASLNKSWFNE